MRLSHRQLALLCFFLVYVIWGSTYLAIRYGIETLPPWMMSSVRFFVASFLMWILSRWKKENATLTSAEKKSAIISGLLLVFANGMVGCVELSLPSGLVAVVIGAMPIWIMGIGWLFFDQARPTLQKSIGALIGLAGIALIATNESGDGHGARNLIGAATLFFSSWCWAFGTLVQRKTPGVKSVFKYSALQMVCGACGVGILSLILEKPWAFDFSAVSQASLIALLYLILFGSVVAFTAYAWLSRNIEPSLVSTYALVNPVIAVLVGWAWKAEVVDSRFFTATILVLLGLSLLMMKPFARKVAAPPSMAEKL